MPFKLIGIAVRPSPTLAQSQNQLPQNLAPKFVIASIHYRSTRIYVVKSPVPAKKVRTREVFSSGEVHLKKD